MTSAGYLIVSSYMDCTLSAICIASGEVEQIARTGGYCFGVALSEMDQTLYVALYDTNQIRSFDLRERYFTA